MPRPYASRAMGGADAILQAVRSGDVARVKRLLSGDARLARATGEHLKTPLHWAAEHDLRDIAEMLLQAGADLTIRDTKFASTPEGWAAEGQHARICELLHRW